MTAAIFKAGVSSPKPVRNEDYIKAMNLLLDLILDEPITTIAGGASRGARWNTKAWRTKQEILDLYAYAIEKAKVETNRRR